MGCEARGDDLGREGEDVRVVVYRGTEKGTAAVGRLIENINSVAVTEEVGGPAWITIRLSEPVL